MIEPQVDLNLLWTLKVLLEERNVTRAAERLNMTQSALSHRLRRLRDLLGDPLFVATSHGLTPTSRAEAIAGPLSDGIRHLQTAMQAVEAFDPLTTRRPLRLAAVDQAEVAYLVPMMRALNKSAPGVDLVVQTPGPETYEQLEAGEIDLLFTPYVPDRAGLRQRTILEHRPVAIVRSGHPVIAQGLTLDRYCELSHIVVSPPGSRESGVDRALSAMGRSRRIACEVPRFAGAAFMVVQTDMVLTTTDAFAEAAGRHLDLTALECPLDLPTARIRMAWHERFDRDPAHRWFRDFLTTKVRP